MELVPDYEGLDGTLRIYFNFDSYFLLKYLSRSRKLGCFYCSVYGLRLFFEMWGWN